jgi:hypothetical protein
MAAAAAGYTFIEGIRFAGMSTVSQKFFPASSDICV